MINIIKWFSKILLFAFIAWFISQLAFWFCYFTYEIIGKYIILPIYWIANWPLSIWSLFLPEPLPDWYYRIAIYFLYFIPFVGWLMLALVIGITLKILSASKKRFNSLSNRV